MQVQFYPQRPRRSSKPDPDVEAATRVLAKKFPGLDAIRLDNAIRLSLASSQAITVPPPENKLISYHEAARRLDVSVKSIRRMAARGVFDQVLLGRRTVRVREADLMRIIAGQAITTSTSAKEG